jgi:hypothetical protein
MACLAFWMIQFQRRWNVGKGTISPSYIKCIHIKSQQQQPLSCFHPVPKYSFPSWPLFSEPINVIRIAPHGRNHGSLFFDLVRAACGETQSDWWARPMEESTISEKMNLQSSHTCIAATCAGIDASCAECLTPTGERHLPKQQPTAPANCDFRLL